MGRTIARALAALSVAGWLGIATAASQSGGVEVRADAGSPAPSTDGGGHATDGGAVRDADQEVIDHLDELENLDLLQNLGLLDPSGEDDAPTGSPNKPSPR
jgi:hypothetical protein